MSASASVAIMVLLALANAFMALSSDAAKSVNWFACGFCTAIALALAFK